MTYLVAPQNLYLKRNCPLCNSKLIRSELRTKNDRSRIIRKNKDCSTCKITLSRYNSGTYLVYKLCGNIRVIWMLTMGLVYTCRIADETDPLHQRINLGCILPLDITEDRLTKLQQTLNTFS